VHVRVASNWYRMVEGAEAEVYTVYTDSHDKMVYLVKFAG
jgi:hypothetical protein